MPELPEVETVVNTLKKRILDRPITKIDVYYEKMIKSDINEFKSLVGEKINDIDRYGKYIIFILDDHYLISHLRMEGKYYVEPVEALLEKHTHVVFTFNTLSLRYNDVRKFGTMLVLDKDVDYIKFINKGVDPTKNRLTVDYLMSKRNNKHLKTWLLDQNVIAGIGNIYGDEICFHAKLNPFLITKDLNEKDCQKIIDSVEMVFTKAIIAGGTTIRSYTSSLGVSGRFQQNLMVHTRQGQACYICKSTIIKTKINGRGTYYCPKCQKTKHAVFALTGSIATGKSYVSNILSKTYEVISLDEINRDLLKEGNSIYNALTSVFDIKNDDNTIDKQKLREIVFNSKTKRKLVNSLSHPLIKAELKTRIDNSSRKIIIVEVPLLFESEMSFFEDYTVCVYVDQNTQIERLIKRDNITKKTALKIIQTQIDIEKKKHLADYVVDTRTKESLNDDINKLKAVIQEVENAL